MYTVYVHINKTTHHRYVGMTSKLPRTRWSKGTGYKSQKYFYAAICKYGWDGFEHIILAEVNSFKEADELETYFINYYDTTNPEKGYNQLKGDGQLAEDTLQRRAESSTNHPFYQYDIHYNFLRTWNSARELKKNGYHMHSIYGCCSGKLKTYHGFIWSNTPLEHPALKHNTFINFLFNHWNKSL